MNLYRFFAMVAILFAVSLSLHAQQTIQTTPDAKTVQPAAGELDQVAFAERSRHPRADAMRLSEAAKNPFGESSEATPAPPKPQAVVADKWQFQLTPYLWIAGISGQAGIGNLITDVDAGITDENVDLNFGFMGTLEARKNKLVILTDLQYSNLGTDRATPRSLLFSSASADFKTFVLDPEVGYRVLDNPEKGAFVDVLGGIRYWHLRTDLTFNAGLLSAVTATRSRGWVDAVGGIRGKAHISKRVFLTGKADLGGGGSKFTYQLFGGAGILVGSKYALILGYRDLSVNYDKDGFLFDTSLQGPILGFGIKF